MLMAVRDSQAVTLMIASDVSYIHAAVRRAEAFIQEYAEDNSSKIAVVLRELLSNAITHGNNNDIDRTVQCRIEHAGGGQFKVVVEDEGDGFDYGNLDTALPDDPRNLRHRGYVLVRNLCRSLEFNTRGNRVTVVIDAEDQGFGTRGRERHAG